MTNKPPVGAITGEDLKNLRSLYYIKKSPRGYYLVTGSGNFSINGNYGFTSVPPCYYFNNYFHAWAYHLRMIRKWNHEK